MRVIELPLGRLGEERGVLRTRLAIPRAPRAGLTVVQGRLAYCASCAAPVEFGAVTRGGWTFCSIECSLGGDKPA